MRPFDTVIVGGGIAGLACARRLHDAGRDFVLLTDRLGGRMYADLERGGHFGDTYVTTDYRQVLHYVRCGSRIWFRDIYFADGRRFVNIFHPGNLRHARALAQLYARLAVFRIHLNRLRAQSPYVCQAELLRQDPLLCQYTEQPAREFIARHGLEEVDEIFTNPMAHSTVFVPTSELNTFYYLACLMPIMLPTYLADFRDTLGQLTAGYEDRINLTLVVEAEPRRSGGYTVRTTERDFVARNLVIATPGHNTRRFFPSLDRADDDGVREVPVCTLHVAGQRRPEFLPGKMVFQRPGKPATVLVPLDGYDLLFTPTRDPDLACYYENYRILARAEWKTAVQLSGGRWRSLRPRPDLYTIGDYNICGLEDSFLTGLFAANSILAGSARSVHDQRAQRATQRV